jgi:hypothetical protein
MMNFLPSFPGFQGLDSCAFVAPTLSPRNRGPVSTHTPRPLSPRRAKEGANSRIWPCLLDGMYKLTGRWPTAIHRRACFLASCRSPASGRMTRWVTTTCTMHFPVRPEGWAPTGVAGTVGPTAGTSSLCTRGHMRLLAPLSAPPGVERGGGDRGGKNTTVEFLGRLGQAQKNRGENT